MARRDDEVADSPSNRTARKRSQREFNDANSADIEGTPSKRRKALPSGSLSQTSEHDPYAFPENGDLENGMDAEKPTPAPTPTPKRKRGRPPKNATPTTNGTSTPSKQRQAKNVETPKKATDANGFTPRRKAAVDRSAKRKSARALIERVVGDEVSEEEDEEGLVREIYETSEEEGEEDENLGDGTAAPFAGAPGDATATPKATPSRRGRKPKPKARSPTPPRDLPPHELYFEHNKPGRAKTSNNTLAALDLLTHEEYFSVLRDYKDPHAEDIVYLQSLHESSFGQWSFELAQGFSLCLYGTGSKRELLTSFAEHTYAATRDRNKHKIVVVNGYVRNLTLRDVLQTVASAMVLDPSSAKLPAHPSAMLQSLLSLLSDSDTTITLLVNSVDAPALRKASVQQALSSLAAHPNVRFLCSADTPDFPLLWDAALRASFNFIFHDATTFAATSTAELDHVDEVHSLLGRQVRAVNGKEGVAFVLRSLPENAKNLFRLLVTEVLVALDDEGGGDHHEGSDNPGVEYRMVYNKAVEEFICTSEMAFRTLLKEFHDHQMITSRKDSFGTEMLSIPFRREELEGILEELMT